MEFPGKTIFSLTAFLRLLDGKSTPQERLGIYYCKGVSKHLLAKCIRKKMFGKQYYLNAQKIPSEIEGCSCSKKMSLKCSFMETKLLISFFIFFQHVDLQ